MTNEFEEIRMLILAPSKSHLHLVEPLKAVNRSLEMHGRDFPQVIYTDNVLQDQPFLSSVFPSIYEPPSSDLQLKYDSLPPYTLPSTISIHNFSTSEGLTNVADELFESLSNVKKESGDDSKVIHIGFDCEWDFDPVIKVTSKVAVVQIAYGTDIWVVQVAFVFLCCFHGIYTKRCICL